MNPLLPKGAEDGITMGLFNKRKGLKWSLEHAAHLMQTPGPCGPVPFDIKRHDDSEMIKSAFDSNIVYKSADECSEDLRR